MYKYKIYLYNGFGSCKNNDELVGSFESELDLIEFVKKENIFKILKEKTNPDSGVKELIEEAYYLRYQLITDKIPHYLWIDYGSHIRFICIKCIGETTE